ncbi:MAG: nitroreductase family protein [Butyricicoccaceae bacterium]
MDFMSMLAARESCRSYQDKPVSREDLTKIAEAGRLSPSGCNAQPWKFIVVDEPEAKEKLCDALVVEGGATGCPWRAQVPAFIALVEQPAKVMPSVKKYYGDTQRFAQGDIGMAAMNMCYEAMELGLSTCILGMCDQSKLEQAFGIPEGHEVRMILAVGYSAEDPGPRKKVRKDLDEVCSFNHW